MRKSSPNPSASNSRAMPAGPWSRDWSAPAGSVRARPEPGGTNHATGAAAACHSPASLPCIDKYAASCHARLDPRAGQLQRRTDWAAPPSHARPSPPRGQEGRQCRGTAGHRWPTPPPGRPASGPRVTHPGKALELPVRSAVRICSNLGANSAKRTRAAHHHIRGAKVGQARGRRLTGHPVIEHAEHAAGVGICGREWVVIQVKSWSGDGQCRCAEAGCTHRRSCARTSNPGGNQDHQVEGAGRSAQARSRCDAAFAPAPR